MMNQTHQVLILGDACVDLLVRVPEKSGNPRELVQPELLGGGTGANTAVGLARLGVATALLGTVGEDGYGRFTRNTLAAEGIDTTHLFDASDAFTTITLALIDQHGERTLFGWPRRGAAHTRLAVEQVDATIVQQAAWVHTTGICLVESPSQDAVLHGLALAHAAGIPVSLDLNLRLGFENGRLPSAFLAVLRKAIALSTYVLGSATDELVYLGAPDATYQEAAQELANAGQTVIARLGAQGALVVAPGRAAQLVSAFPITVVDTLGAGDAFNAGFITASLEGRPLGEAVRWGHAVAALKLGKPGARSTPRRVEVEQLLLSA